MKVRKIVFLSVLLSLAIIIGYVESLIPVISFITIPGIKLGLANVIILLTIYKYKWYEAFFVMILRVVIVSIILGTFLTTPFFMSLFGAVFSFGIMLLLSKVKFFTIIGISVAGALFHSFGQIIVAMIVMDSVMVFYYLPFIILLSIPTGIIVGLISYKLNKMKIFNLQKYEEMN